MFYVSHSSWILLSSLSDFGSDQIYVEMGMGSLSRYQDDFQTPFLAATATFYARLAAAWLHSESCPSFMLKVRASR